MTSIFIGIGILLAVAPVQDQSVAARPEPAPAAAETHETSIATGFLYRTIEYQGAEYAYCVFVPPTYSEERAWPVILALHGSGEVGEDGFLQTQVGIGTAIRRNWKRFPAIVVMPQCRQGQWWEGEMLGMALKCVEDASGVYRCDPERVYLTGLSMGGAGVWSLAAKSPDAFAAVVPICGFWGHPFKPAPEDQLKAAAKNLAKLPIWCFHGMMDKNVPIERDREIVQAVEQAGGTIKFTEIQGGEHNVWDQTYANPELWKWLFAQKRVAGGK